VFNFIKGIFSSKPKDKAKVSTEVQTTPLSEDQLAVVAQSSLTHKPPQYLMASGQSVGLQRDHNEDTLYTLSTVIADGSNDLPFGICLVADGMGGHKNGEIASGVAARVMAKNLVTRVYTRLLDIHSEPMDQSIQEAMENAITETQKAVIRYAPGGGTTLTCALIIGEQVTLAHVGDSRAYFIYPDGRILRITKDHSLVQRMIDLEEITEEEAFTHPQKNVLLKAIGQVESVRPDIQTHQIPKSGYLMICSDGLCGVVPDIEIYRIVAGSTDLVKTCYRLIEAANAGGGPDNISVVLVDFFR
jgi:PPM family protein phosphatase